MLYSTPNPHGGDLYSREIRLDFSANINPYGTPEAVKQAVIDSVSDLRHYPDPYCRELVTAISEFEGVGKEKILCPRSSQWPSCRLRRNLQQQRLHSASAA